MFLTAEVERFFAAWQGLRVEESIPHYRALFDALAPDLIPGMMLLEEAADARYIVRFMGTTLVDLWGADLTGQDRFAALPPKAAATAVQHIGEILGHPCGATAVQPYGARAQAEAEVLLLPVGNDDGKPRRLVGFARTLRDAQPAAGLGEPPSTLYEERWLDLGFGTPKRRPAPVFRR
jgi:hypothetical protein